MWTLSNIGPNKGAKKKRKRVGRGPGSGHGKTATKGTKGQLARSGGGKGPGFEGGQMPLYRRLPKRGFKNPFKIVYQVVNLGKINERFGENDVVNKETLKEKGLIRKVDLPVKILAKGELTKPLRFEGIEAASKKAIEIIEKSGGAIELISREGGNKA